MSKFLSGIFCLEGFWPTQNPSFSAIKPTLKAIQDSSGFRVIHHHPVTLPQLKKYISVWTTPKFHSYSVLCLSFHGESGAIYVGQEIVTLEEIADLIGGKGYGRMVYFSSCATLSVKQSRIMNFLKNCDLKRVAGYDHYVSISDAQIEDEETLYKLLSQNLSKTPLKTNKTFMNV